jgi:hypothetical protein
MARGRRIKNALKKVINVGKKVGKAVLPPMKDIAGQVLPHLLKALSTKAVGAIAGIPFRESGMMASATPVSSSGGIQVSAPSANGKITRTGGPKQRSIPNGNSIVSHREYVTDINLVETGFDLQFQFGINPGNSSLFPWLSQIAQRYELYKFKSLRFVYEPQCGTSSSGTVFIAVDWDASDPPPESKTQMMSYKNAVRSPLWFASEYNAGSSDLTRLKTNYILSGAAPEGTDIKTYDIGNLFVAIQSDSGTDQTAGELYVEYTVELITPQIINEPLSAVHYEQQLTANLATTGSITTVGNLVTKFEYVAADNEISGVRLWIGQAGYFQVVGTIAGNASNFPNFSNIVLGQGNGNLYGINAFPEDGSPYNAIFSQFVQVVNPEVQALGFDFNALQESNPVGFTLSVLPVAQAATLLNGLTPVTPALNPRARLGRIRPYPAS